MSTCQAILVKILIPEFGEKPEVLPQVTTSNCDGQDLNLELGTYSEGCHHKFRTPNFEWVFTFRTFNIFSIFCKIPGWNEPDSNLLQTEWPSHSLLTKMIIATFHAWNCRKDFSPNPTSNFSPRTCIRPGLCVELFGLPQKPTKQTLGGQWLHGTLGNPLEILDLTTMGIWTRIGKRYGDVKQSSGCWLRHPPLRDISY